MFWSLARIAIRNVTRNTKRSLITTAAIIIGCAVIVFARGLINAIHKSMVEGITQTSTGDVQIHHKDYLEATDAMPLDLAVVLNEDLVRVLRQDPRIDAWSGRLRFTGMISNGITTSLFIANAIDPDTEYEVTPDLQRDVLPGGAPTSNDQPDGMVVSDKMARAMNLEIGDSVFLTATTPEGALNTKDMVIVGIRQAAASLTGTEGKSIEIPLKTAQDLLLMDDQVTEIALNVTDFQEATGVALDLQTRLDREVPELNLASNDWMQVSEFFVDLLRTQDFTLWIVIFILFAVMVTGIVNTMLMAVLERVREIGTMMAIGIRRKKIVVMFLCEAVALGLIGSTLGVIAGYIMVWIFYFKGVVVHPATYSKPLIVRPFVGWEFLLVVIVIAQLAALLAAIYPARRASQLEPATALRTL